MTDQQPPKTWPVGIITVPGILTPDARARLEQTWMEAFGGVGLAPRVLIFEEGMTYIPLLPFPPGPVPQKDGGPESITPTGTECRDGARPSALPHTPSSG